MLFSAGLKHTVLLVLQQKIFLSFTHESTAVLLLTSWVFVCYGTGSMTGKTEISFQLKIPVLFPKISHEYTHGECSDIIGDTFPS